jgi:hypothetical protein
VHNADVAVVYVAFINDLFFAAGWAEQVAQGEVLQFLADLIGTGCF